MTGTRGSEGYFDEIHRPKRLTTYAMPCYACNVSDCVRRIFDKLIVDHCSLMVDRGWLMKHVTCFLKNGMKELSVVLQPATRPIFHPTWDVKHVTHNFEKWVNGLIVVFKASYASHLPSHGGVKHVTHFSKNGMHGVNCCIYSRLRVPFTVPRGMEVVGSG